MANQVDKQRPADRQARSGSSDAQSLARRDDQQAGTRMAAGSGVEQREQRDFTHYGGLLSPFDLMRRFSQDVDRMLSSLGLRDFGSFSVPASPLTSASASMATWTPSVEVTTRGDDLVISVDLPGVRPEDTQVEVQGNNLVIRGETRAESEKKDQGYLYSERVYGSFYRSIPLPPSVPTDNARADFNNGVLEVTLPGAAKALQPQRRSIEVQGAQQGSQQPQQPQQPQPVQTGQDSGNIH